MKALNEMETIVRKDKEKIKIMEDTLDEERNSLLEKVSRTVAEVDAQKTKYEEMQQVLSGARNDIIKLEQENAKLKEQVSTDQRISFGANIFKIDNFLITRLLLIGLRLLNPLLIVCFR